MYPQLIQNRNTFHNWVFQKYQNRNMVICHNWVFQKYQNRNMVIKTEISKKKHNWVFQKYFPWHTSTTNKWSTIQCQILLTVGWIYSQADYQREHICSYKWIFTLEKRTLLRIFEVFIWVIQYQNYNSIRDNEPWVGLGD